MKSVVKSRPNGPSKWKSLACTFSVHAVSSLIFDPRYLEKLLFVWKLKLGRFNTRKRKIYHLSISFWNTLWWNYFRLPSKTARVSPAIKTFDDVVKIGRITIFLSFMLNTVLRRMRKWNSNCHYYHFSRWNAPLTPWRMTSVFTN